MNIEKFTIAIPDAELDDLRQRLERVRWADDYANDDWRYGTNGAYLKELVSYWRDHYDWRKHEAAINAWPQFKTVIDDVPIHFIHVKGKGPNPTPIIITHGWPWTFWDFQNIIGPLTDPAAHGGDPADAFDVVIPSLPGYGFSTPLRKPGMNFWQTADLWVKLMEGLGYPRFAAHGEDWGAFITAQLGHKHADRLIGTHFTIMVPLDMFSGGMVSREYYGPEDKAQAKKNAMFFANESGYMMLQCSKPQTPAFALNDSPVGLCSWILEKRRTWSDCNGDVESRFSKDDLITTVMIYWLTQSYGTSARYYYEARHNPWTPSHDKTPVVQAPTGIAVFRNECVIQPKRWAQEYYNLQRWTEFPSGGHFAAFEEAEALIGDLRAFFRELQ
ncbi:MAG: epoxide hydrolase family protein [Porticoccaceae bacterium]